MSSKPIPESKYMYFKVREWKSACKQLEPYTRDQHPGWFAGWLSSFQGRFTHPKLDATCMINHIYLPRFQALVGNEARYLSAVIL